MSHEPLQVHDLMLQAPSGVSSVMAGNWRSVTGVDNLVQAIWLRLNTPQGALAELGHADYGSRLFRLIGELDGQVTRDRARLYVASALRQEARIAAIVSIHITGEVHGKSVRLIVTATVLPVGHTQPLALRFPVFLDNA
jgi:phage baseplate assembly protein W